MKINTEDCYKAVSDLISDSYKWLSNENNKEGSIYYILGLNDMARYLAEMIDGAEMIDCVEEGIDV